MDLTRIQFPFIPTLPYALKDIQCRVTTGRNGEMVFHIDTRNSLFKHRKVDELNSRERRKIDNLFILAYSRERVRIAYE